MERDIQRKIDSYLEHLRKNLGPMDYTGIQDVIAELRSHILERATSDGEMTPATVESALVALGKPEILARQFLTLQVLGDAEASRSPVKILNGLLRWASLSMTGFITLIGTVTGYFLGISLLLSAVLKMVNPATAGLWIIKDGRDDYAVSLRMGFGSAPLEGSEILGWWIVPLGLLLGCGLILLSTRFALLCVRKYRGSIRISRH